MRSLPAILLFLVVAIACVQPGATPTSPSTASGSSAVSSSLSATVRFGNDSVGSKFPTPSGHDQSGHARDNLIPREVVIDQGGTVTFVMGGRVHQVGIYDDGTSPDQVIRAGAVTKAGCPPAPYVTGVGDPNLVAIVGQPMCAGGASSVSYTFQTPGRYLVICAVLPHFVEGMYGFVKVNP